MYKHLILFFLVIALATVARAGDVDVRVRPAVLMPGQRAMLEIESDEIGLDRLPQPPVVDGLQFASQGANRLRRGNAVRIVAYYVISPARTGTIVIPSFTVPLAGGRTTTTKPVDLTVLAETDLGPPPPANRKFHAILLTPKSSYFSGEQFPIQALLLVDPQVNLNGVEQPRLPREGFAIDRFDNPIQGELMYAGRAWRSIAYSARCTATASGTVTLGPLDAKAVIGIPEEGGNGFFQRARDFPITAQSPPRVLEIKPFPANPPASFEGAVGEFTLAAAFDPPPTRADEPIAVRLTVRGKGDAAQISIPRMDDESAWEIFDGAREEAPRDTGDLHGEVSFRRILRSKSNQARVIPSFNLVYLNPANGKYETARTAPLAIPALTGTPATTPVAPNTSTPGVAPAPGPPTALPAPATLQAQGLILSLPSGDEPRWVPARAWTWPAGWVVHAIGLTALAAMGIRRWHRKHAATDAGKRAACRRAFRARLRRIAKIPGEEARLLESLRWIEDWQHSPLARPISPEESTTITAMRAALNDRRYANHSRSDGRSSVPPPADLISLLEAPRP